MVIDQTDVYALEDVGEPGQKYVVRQLGQKFSDTLPVFGIPRVVSVHSHEEDAVAVYEALTHHLPNGVFLNDDVHVMLDALLKRARAAPKPETTKDPVPTP